MKCADILGETAIRNFREYLRIATVHPDINFDTCIVFLKNYADELDLSFKVFNFVPNKPIVLMTWKGTDPSASSILLNSHADVVPVTEENWNHPPFEANMDEEGNIFARGAQDMKCVAIMYLEAIRRLICKGVHFKRTFHLSFMPDEEVGGTEGMAVFIKTEEFKQLNIGFSLDEGYCTPNKYYPVFYGENICWQVTVRCRGNPGHGSSLQRNTAGEKFRVIVNKFMDYRDKMLSQKETSDKNPSAESITSVNLTQVSGGSHPNIIPDELTATFDIRISIYQDLDEFEQMLNQWCCAAGPDVTLEFILKEKKRPQTSIDCSQSNPFWGAMKQAAEKMKIDLLPIIVAGMSDSRYIREMNIPAFGFTPINETQPRFHGDDEYINKDKLIEGIKIYMEVFAHIGNV